MSARSIHSKVNELTSIVGVDTAEHATIGTTDVVDDDVSRSTIVLAITTVADQLAIV